MAVETLDAPVLPGQFQNDVRHHDHFSRVVLKRQPPSRQVQGR